MLQYRIHPSLLDAYAWYKKCESPAAKRELIDIINRVSLRSDKTDKGTALKALVDGMINKGCNKLEDEKINFGGFEFKTSLVNLLVKDIWNAVPGVHVHAEIETDNGMVLLYGYADEVLGDACIDIKTTGDYDFPKFLHYWHHIIYPYCLNKMGIECNRFTYVVIDFTNIFKEDYLYRESKVANRLKAELNDFIFFLEMNRPWITNRRIFAFDELEEPVNALLF